MAIQFSADEILEVAERIERNGVAFYAAGYQAAKDSPAADLLHRLSVWEEGHVKLFATMRSELTDDERAPMVFDPEDQLSAYLRSMADRTVFTEAMRPAEMFGANPTVKHILQLALEREKDAIVFYAGIRSLVPARFGVDKIDAIIHEEVSHVAIIEKQLSELPA